MVDPAALIIALRALLLPEGIAQVAEACLRRAISTAYYALFHHLARATADRFVGQDERGSAPYSLVYRALSHTKVAEACKKLDRETLSDSVQEVTGRKSVAAEIRYFARAFLVLQELREMADYEPVAEPFEQGNWLYIVDEAEVAMRSFDDAPDSERTTVLALMLFSPRR